MRWIGALLALCILGGAAELLWSDKIFNWLAGGRPAHERADIIGSYRRAAEAGSVPPPAGTDAFEIYYLAKDSPYRMAVRVRTESGETRQFQLVRPAETSGTNWGFLADDSGQVDARQTQGILASYFQRAASGLVPKPAATQAIKVFPTGVWVITEAGERKWFHLVRPRGGTGTNWGFTQFNLQDRCAR